MALAARRVGARHQGETIALSGVIIAVAGGRPTIGRMLPYFLVSSFMKTALLPTRTAFEVDLLRREEVQIDASGAPITDEQGNPRAYKVHLLSFRTITSFLRATAGFGGLLLGGRILAVVHNSYATLFTVDVVTNVGFIAFITWGCHPEHAPRDVRLRELFGESDGAGAPGVRASAAAEGRSIIATGMREFIVSLREAWSFLRHPEQRPLCWLLVGAWTIEVVNEFYHGGMIVLHVLHGSAEAMRHAEIVWSAGAVVILAVLPVLSQRVSQLGKIFVLTMLVDGIVIAAAGRVSAVAAATAIVPFTALLAADRGLTLTSDALIGLAQNSASSAAIRGRIAASYAMVVIVSDMLAEIVSTALSEKVGIPGMLMRVGVAQVVLMAVVLALGGRRLWNFGLRSTEATSLAPAASTTGIVAA